MTLSIIVASISLILDIILNNFLPYLNNNLSLFTPMFCLVSLFFVYPLMKKKEYNYYVFCFVFGIIYDLFFTDLLFFNAILFLLMGIVIKNLYKYLEVNYINIIIHILVLIIAYEVIATIIILVFNLVPMSFYRLIYKISHSIIINIIYGELLYFIINHLPKKYRSLSIN